MLNSIFIQVFKFGLVGVWNTIFDLVLFGILFRFLQKKFSEGAVRKLKNETLAHIGSFLCANMVSYQLNSRFTFENGRSSGLQIFLYVCVSILSLGISSLIINHLADKKFFDSTKKTLLKISKSRFNKTFALTKSQYAILIKIIAVVVVMSVNFFGYKYIVFK
jgi:putative flippase GtrA